MASYFSLELDTTGPTIEILAPVSVPPTNLELRIESNEVMASSYELYLIDPAGDRFDYTISHYGDYLEGTLPVNNVKRGIATIYARVRDEVFNLSNIASANVYIMPTRSIHVFLTVLTRHIGVVAKKRNITPVIFSRSIRTVVRKATIGLTTVVRNIVAKVVRVIRR